MPFSVREGINIFLDGFVPTENLRFREVSLTFKISTDEDIEVKERLHQSTYPNIKKLMGDFHLEVKPGHFADSEIIVMLGQNGTGKTTFIRMLAGYLRPDQEEGEEEVEMPVLNVSYKPQKIGAKFEGTVQELLLTKVKDAYMHPQFNTDVSKPMLIDRIADHGVQTLSGGELQRVVAARVLKRFILHAKKTAFIVEHDFIMATYLADRVIVYEGEPGVKCVASSPMPLLEGMNKFLAQLEITFRRDPTNFRPRINKVDSVKDREQKQCGAYFVLED